MAKYKIDGMKDLERIFQKLKRVPQTVATKAARSGATILLRATRANAPFDTGALRKGIILKRERRTVQGKAVYQVTFDPAMNAIFQKKVIDGKNAYYPASMEYGFLTVNGGYVPGYRFMRDAAIDNASNVERKMVEVAGKAIDKAMRG